MRAHTAPKSVPEAGAHERSVRLRTADLVDMCRAQLVDLFQD